MTDRPPTIPSCSCAVVADRHAYPAAPAAVGRLGEACQYPEQARFAGAVQTHDEEALATLDGEGHILEHRWAAVSLGKAFRFYDHTARMRRAGKVTL